MKRIVLLFLLLTPLMAQQAIEIKVLQNVKKMMSGSGGRVTFSTLINDPSFSKEEKAFLGRLYEVFFQIPGVLKSEYESTQEIPSRKSLGANFGISAHSVDLLLAVMKSDPRVPSLFTLDSSSREIVSLNIPNIEAFVERRGAAVKMTSWEGQRLPSFQAKAFNGSSFSSADQKGQGTLVYFWFSGCPPCVRITPHLVELDSKYGDKGFRIIGVNADKVLGIGASDADRAEYLKGKGVDFLNVHMNDALRKAYGGINIFPTLFFADSVGNITDHLINYHDMATLEKAVRKVAANVE